MNKSRKYEISMQKMEIKKYVKEIILALMPSALITMVVIILYGICRRLLDYRNLKSMIFICTFIIAAVVTGVFFQRTKTGFIYSNIIFIIVNAIIEIVVYDYFLTYQIGIFGKYKLDEYLSIEHWKTQLTILFFIIIWSITISILIKTKKMVIKRIKTRT
jgi:hypothetical protein